MEDATAPHTLREMTAEMFQPLVGHDVSFQRPAAHLETVGLTLINVRVSRHSSIPGMRQPFALLFRLRDAPPLDDRRTHTLFHPDFERCELLLTRVTVPGLDIHDGAMYYEAVFG